MLHDCAGAFNASGDLASASAGPAAQGVSRGMGWTGRLYWDGRCIHAQAKAAEAVLNPYAHAFVKASITRRLTFSTQKTIRVARRLAT